MIEKNNNMGTVNISLDVVATIAGGAAIECYGVVGMASRKRLKDDVNLYNYPVYNGYKFLLI